MRNRMLRRIFRRGDVDCRDTRELGSDYLDDDLDPPKRSAVQAHLDKCVPWRAFIDGLSATIGVLSRFPRASVQPRQTARHLAAGGRHLLLLQSLFFLQGLVL